MDKTIAYLWTDSLCCSCLALLSHHNRSAGYWRKLWPLWLPAPQPCPPPAEGSCLPPRSPRTLSSVHWPTGNASRNYWRGSRWMADWLITVCQMHVMILLRITGAGTVVLWLVVWLIVPCLWLDVTDGQHGECGMETEKKWQDQWHQHRWRQHENRQKVCEISSILGILADILRNRGLNETLCGRALTRYMSILGEIVGHRVQKVERDWEQPEKKKKNRPVPT